MSHEWVLIEELGGGIWACRLCRSLVASDERPHPLLPVWADSSRSSYSCEEVVALEVLKS